MIRKTVVSGAFYPSDKKILSYQIKNYLAKAKQLKINKLLKVLILPHAGWDFSGQVAAWGIKQIEGRKITRVILVGCSHQVYFTHAALYDKGSWETPLGMVKVDENLAVNLMGKTDSLHSLKNKSRGALSNSRNSLPEWENGWENGIRKDFEPHFGEHSLEVELPFLQQTLKTFKIVPILLGSTNRKILDKLAKVIALNFDNQTLLLISSDLSHYPDYETALKVDHETIKAILSGNPEVLEKTIRKNFNQSGVDTCVCAKDAVVLGMLVAQCLKAKEIKLFKYLNSGDITGDKSRVVGYASIGFS